MKMETRKELIDCTQEDILAVAKNLYGDEKIRAYRLARREDLVLRAADEEISIAGIHLVYRPYTGWPILEKKQEFDRKKVPYSPNAVKKALKNVKLEVYCDSPTSSQINRIDAILKKNELDEEERMAVFRRARDDEVPAWSSDGIYRFWYHGKETGHSVLAAHTGVPRARVVGQYLDAIFENPRHVVYNESTPDWVNRFARFVERENIPGEEVISRAIRAFEKLDSLGKYHLAHALSHTKRVVFPRETVLDLLRNLAREHPACDDTYTDETALPLIRGLEKDPEVCKLRRNSLKWLIENGSTCNVVLGERKEIRRYGITIDEPWFKRAIERDLRKGFKSTDEYELRTVINVAKEYGLLSEKDISVLDGRVNLLKKIKNEQ